MEKTNVMRLLDQKLIKYQAFHREHDPVDGIPIYKTLVTVSKSNKHYVFVIPVEKTLDLKKAAKAVDEKAIQMLKEKELLPLTGYVHGGCSPIGMKKTFPTVFDQSALKAKRIAFSAGKVNYSVGLQVTDLTDLLSFLVADVTQ